MRRRAGRTRGGQRTEDSGKAPGAVEPDTVCAVATPPGIGGIAVVRVSGPQALAVLDRVVQGGQPSQQSDHSVRLVRITDRDGAVLDEVMLAVFRAPRSYTGEDVVEISCHGGGYIADEIVRTLCAHGCRPAGPGEFSRRAVMNGKLTLSRAEAVMDLVNARTPEAHRAAFARYSGSLGRLTGELLVELKELRAEAEYHLSIDENDSPRPAGLAGRIRTLLRKIEALLTDADRSRFLHDGARVAIIGRPNVGKSSLFNRLVGEDRAVVAPSPGTTRDRVELTVAFGSVPVMLTDTGGVTGRRTVIRGSADRPETIARGVAGQTDAAIAAADLVLAVFDGSQPLRPADRRVIELVERYESRVSGADDPARRPATAHVSGGGVSEHDLRSTSGNDRVICVINKIDLGKRFDDSRLNGSPRVRVSALTGDNITRLRRMITCRFRPGRESLAVATRHRMVLAGCRDALVRSLEAPDAAITLTELEAACDSLAEIDVPVERDDILKMIFDRFCVGK